MNNFTITNDGPKIRHDDGTLSDAPSVPFYQWSLLGGWKAVCVKHNLMFMRKGGYERHWNTVCEGVAPGDLPEHDMAIKNRTFKFKKVWL